MTQKHGARVVARLLQLHALRPGVFDDESDRFECAEMPFAAKVLPMSSV